MTEEEDKQDAPLEIPVGGSESDSESTTSESKGVAPPIKKRGPGRPRKSEINQYKTGKGNRKVGRPPGQAAALNEYKAMMFRSPKSRKVLKKIMAAALDDDHKNQAVAWKLMMDRMMPVSHFEKGNAGGTKVEFTINVSKDDEVTKDVTPKGDIEDADYEEVEDG